MHAPQEKALLLRPKVLDRVRPECKIEPLHKVIREVASLSYQAYIEAGVDYDYKPDIGEMIRYDVMGSCLLVTLRHEGTLVGYALYLIGLFKHNVDMQQAQLESVYICPEFRDGRNDIYLFRLGEEELKRRKVDFITVASSAKYPIDTLLKRRKYEPLETVYMKRL